VGELWDFLAAQPDLSPKCWPRYVRVTAELPMTATFKTLKRQLVAEGAVAGAGVLWVRELRETEYHETKRQVRNSCESR
jgi:fatty-acyl-CoA synthase